ncbi:MAG: ribosome silencing factor [Thermodesulfobacteriota bacterium]
MESKDKALVIARAAWEKKAQDIKLIEMKALSNITDYFVICSANSDRGVKTIVDHIERKLNEIGQRVIGIEGYTEGKWVLIDAVDVVVHVFYEPLRKFYDLEGLWIDSPRIGIPFVGEFPIAAEDLGELA